MSAPDATLDRRGFLKAGGAMVVGFALAPALAGRAAAQFGPVPGAPDPEQIDTWLAIHEDNTATLYMGYAELGQGCTTALPQVAAEELDLTLDQIASVPLETGTTPNQGGTYSSAAIARGSPPVRAAAAEARQALMAMASEYLAEPVSNLRVEGGVVSAVGAPAKIVTYGELVGGRRFDLAFTGTALVKDPADYRIVGQGAPRKDLAAKLTGAYPYMQHERLPGMLHGRIVRPRGQRAYGENAPFAAIVAGDLPAEFNGARVLSYPAFVAVVAEREWDAVRAAEFQLNRCALVRDVTGGPGLPEARAHDLPHQSELYAAMRAAPATDGVVLDDGDAEAALAAAARRSSFTAECPYQMHAPFAPNCALADVREDSALVICSSQDIYSTRRTIAALVGLPQEAVTVRYREGSGTYGKSCYDDCAQAAALASKLAGAPVRMQYMRWDEHGWDCCGPAHIGEVRVGADAEGRITAYDYEGWQHSWSQVEATEQMAMGTEARGWPAGASRSVNPLVCGGQYAIPNRRLTDHMLAAEDWLRAGWLRSPLDLAFAFTSEQAIDDLAWQFGADPVAFRRNNIADERWLGVLDAVAEAADWTPRAAASDLSDAEVVTGRGVGLGTHLASWGGAAAEVEVDRATGAVRILHLYGAIDAGLAVNPGIVEAQITGQLVQTVGRMLYEEVRFEPTGVTSLDWNTYPVARFADAPKITPIVVQRMDEPSSGAGEEAMAAAAAAIANAFFDATGRRMTSFPFTPERVKAALA